ncbi:hypothetical protein WJ968_11225 [Achromobacter xylosoxidans]
MSTDLYRVNERESEGNPVGSYTVHVVGRCGTFERRPEFWKRFWAAKICMPTTQRKSFSARAAIAGQMWTSAKLRICDWLSGALIDTLAFPRPVLHVDAQDPV